MQPPAEIPPIESLGVKLPEWTPEIVTRVWETLDTYPFLGSLVIVALAYLAAKVAEAIFDRGLRRLTAKTETDFDDQVIEIIHQPVFVAVFFAGLALAFRNLRLDPGHTTTVVNFLQTLVVLVWLRESFPFMRLVLEGLSRHRERFPLIEARTLPLFDITSKILVVAGASWIVLDLWNVNPAPWLASAGVVGVAVGFASKDTLANLFGGFFILADAPYKLGDFIILDSGERGRVTQIGLRSTRLETRDDIEITIPNGAMANAKIINEAGGRWEKERVRIKVGVAYGSDLGQVCAVLERVAVEHAHICKEPAPRVRMRAFGASSLDFELLCWIDEPVLRGRLSHELYMEVYKAFAREAIEIPFTQMDVHVRQLPDADD